MQFFENQLSIIRKDPAHETKSTRNTCATSAGLHRGGDSGEEVAEILMTSPYQSGKEKTTSPRFLAIFEPTFGFACAGESVFCLFTADTDSCFNDR